MYKYVYSKYILYFLFLYTKIAALYFRPPNAVFNDCIKDNNRSFINTFYTHVQYTFLGKVLYTQSVHVANERMFHHKKIFLDIKFMQIEELTFCELNSYSCLALNVIRTHVEMGVMNA